MTVRVELPGHLRTLAGLRGDVRVEVDVATLRAVLDSLEAMYPMLCGTIREHGTGQRRAFMRFFAAEEDVSFLGMEEVLPEAVVSGEEPLMVVGAIAGG